MVVPREHVGSSAIARQRSDPIARQRARLGHKSNRVHARSSVDTRNRCRGTRIATSASGPGRSFLGCYGGRTRPNSRDCRLSPVRSGNHRHFGKPLSASNEFRFLVATHNWSAYGQGLRFPHCCPAPFHSDVFLLASIRSTGREKLQCGGLRVQISPQRFLTCGHMNHDDSDVFTAICGLSYFVPS